MSKTKTRSANDVRSDVKNPNNAAYEADMANREKLGHLTQTSPKGKKS